MLRLLTVLLLGSLGLVGCTAESPEAPVAEVASEESPRAGLLAIAELYRARDFDALVRTRYAELHKAETEEQVTMLIERLRKSCAEPAALENIITTLETAAEEGTPEFSDDGRTATYDVPGSTIRISRMENGRWGFHL